MTALIRAGQRTVTTGDDFQRRLDEHPDDFQTRPVFADWLEERGDPRAEGYRALGRFRMWAHPDGDGFVFWTTSVRQSRAIIPLGGDGGMTPTAVFLSVTASVKRHGLDPWAYLTHVLTELPARVAGTDLADLLSDRWDGRAAGPVAVPG